MAEVLRACVIANSERNRRPFGWGCNRKRRENAEAILSLLETLNRQHGKTIIMVTHDPLAAAHASRRLYMDKGKLDLREQRAAA